jgi:glycosyltransferase involved in cell wall biosynthesis
MRSDFPSIKVVDLSRNFGKEPALTAGLELCSGDIVIPMDVDLQDPPELIPDMIAKWQEGFDVVLAIRSDRSTDSFMKRFTASGFYKLFSRVSDVDLPDNAGDFRLMDRRVVEALKQLPERTRFMKGLFAWLGFKTTQLYFKREERFAGQGKWGSWKLWNFALDGIFSFSTTPLRIWTYLGFSLSVLSVIYLFYVVVDTLIYGNDVAGYPSLVALLLFFNGVILMGLGVVGEYVGRIFLESKRRPIYLIREKIGFDTNNKG